MKHLAREGKKPGAPRDALQHLLAEGTLLGVQEDFLLPKQIAELLLLAPF